MFLIRMNNVTERRVTTELQLGHWQVELADKV